jgi:hypothetical protein
MPVRRDSGGVWRYRKVVTLPDGTTERISGTPAINKQWAALRAEEDHVRRLLDEARNPRTRKEVPTLDEWFFGRKKSRRQGKAFSIRISACWSCWPLGLPSAVAKGWQKPAMMRRWFQQYQIVNL